jgi:hypothetical protein
MAEIYTTPTGLAAAATNYYTIGLTWTNPEADIRVEIQRKPSGGAYSTVDIIDYDNLYLDSTCSSNTLYYYRVRYNDSGNTSPWSTVDSDYTYPKSPATLNVSWVGKTATLTWTNQDTYTYLRTYYKLHSEPTTWTVDSLTLTGTDVTRNITVASESISYDFKIYGYNSTSDLVSEYDIIDGSTSGVMAPTNLAGISGGANSVGLTWTDNSSVEDGYEVYYKLTSATDWTLFETTAADATTSTVTGLTAALSYDFKVRAKDGTAYSAYTSTITIVVIAPPAGTPGTPMATVTGQTTLTLAWTDTATGLTRMYIYQSTDGVTYTEVTYVANAVQTYAVTGLASYTTYYYKLRAWNTAGWSTDYSSASTVVTTTIDLDPPTAMSADALSSTQVKISFTINAGNATRHYVERKVSGSAYSVLGYVNDGTTATYTDGTCVADTEYTFRIRAYNGTYAGYGDYSVPVTKKTLALGVDTVRRNEQFFAMGNVLCIASETPQNSFAAYWRSKPMDMAELGDGDRLKTVYVVQLEYEDTYSAIPTIVSLSTDGGTTWTTSTESVGSADETSKFVNFYFAGVTGKYITMKISVTSSTKGFTWTGIKLFYVPRGEALETA